MVVIDIDLEEMSRRQALDRRPLLAARRPGGAFALSDAVERAKRGDAEAFTFLFESYSSQIYGLLLRLSGDEYEAEDVLQLVLMRVLAKLHLYRSDKGPFLPWLMTLARNVAMDQLRLNRPMPTAEAADWRVAAEDSMGERVQSLRNAFSALPDDQRSVAVLRYIHGLSPGEIAERLGRSESSIHALNHRARASLKTTLSALGCEPSVAV